MVVDVSAKASLKNNFPYVLLQDFPGGKYAAGSATACHLEPVSAYPDYIEPN
jgi:hypothetical protein